MYIKIFRDILIYILTRYRFYNDGFIVKPRPRESEYDKREVLQYTRVFRFLETFVHEKVPR